MKSENCNFEEKIRAASRSGQWSKELLTHVADCRVCEEVALVASYLCESAEKSALDAKLPDARLIWSKAEIGAKAAAMERAMQPIILARRFATAVGALAMTGIIVMAWPSITSFVGKYAESLLGQRHNAAAGSNSVLLFMVMFLLILFPLIFGLYGSWAED